MSTATPTSLPTAPEPGSDPGDRSAASASTHERAFAIALVLMALAPVIVLVVTRFGHAYTPEGDIGLIDLRVRDVWSLNPPLVGPYSNHGNWSHPGPALFYMLSIPALFSGLQAWGTEVGGALWQGVAIVWLAWLAWRRGRLPLLATAMVAVSLVAYATPPWVLRDPWNPHVALPFFLLYVFQIWLVATGDARILPGAVAVGTFLVQTHIGYLALVLTPAVLAFGCWLLDRRGDDPQGRRRWRRPVLWSLVISVVMWLPPLVQTVQQPPGNLWELGRYFVHDEQANPRLGLVRGSQLLAAEFSGRPEWLGGKGDYASFGGLPEGRTLWALVVPVVLLAVGLAVALRRRQRATVRFLVLAGSLVVVGCLSLARIEEPESLYLFLWRPAIAIAVTLGVGWALVSGTRLCGSTGRKVGAVLAAVLVAWGSFHLAREVNDVSRDVPLEIATRSLSNQALRHGVPDGGVILRLQWVSLQIQRGIYNELERQGADVHVDRILDYQFPDGSAKDRSSVARVWWVAESGAALAELMGEPAARLIASWSPLGPRDERRARELSAQVYAELHAVRPDLVKFVSSPFLEIVTREVDGIDHRAAKELTSLNAKVDRRGGQRTGIVSFPPAAAPETLAVG